MSQPDAFPPPGASSWDERASEEFIQSGRYFVPERERQIDTLATLVSARPEPGWVIDLGCGEGLLSQAILEKAPAIRVFGLDGSPAMLRRAQQRLAAFGERFEAHRFNLFERDWPVMKEPLRALVSSLAIHHLDGLQKQALFREVFDSLAPGGWFLIADIVEPASPAGWKLAAEAWDEAVRERSLALDNSLEGFARFEQLQWNTYRYFDPQDIDRPSPLFEQLRWLEQAGFTAVDVFWMRAGHAIFGGIKPGNKV